MEKKKYERKQNRRMVGAPTAVNSFEKQISSVAIRTRQLAGNSDLNLARVHACKSYTVRVDRLLRRCKLLTC